MTEGDHDVFRDDPRFPNRPEHPDLYRMSEILNRVDRLADAGGSYKDLVGVDVASLFYLMEQRIRLLRQRMPDAPDELLAPTLYADAFMLGREFAEAGGHQEPDQDAKS